LYDTVAINILQHYDKALVMAKKAQENSLVDECARNRNIFIQYVLKIYDEQIEWGHFDNQQVEKEFTQYKKAFIAAVDSSSH